MTDPRDARRLAARSRIGITGESSGAATVGLRTALRANGVSAYPLSVVAGLGVADTLHGWGFIVLAPEISHSLGISVAAIAGVLTLKNLLNAIAPMPIAALSRKPRRAVLAVVNGLAWSLAGIGNAFVVSVGGLLGVSTVDGFTTGASAALHTPLLMDLHPPSVRVRALTLYQAALQVANVLSPLLVAVLTGLLFLTWRGVFLVTGLVSLALAVYGLRLRDPGFGRFDDNAIRDLVRPGAAEDPPTSDAVHLGFWETARGLVLVPTIRRLLIGQAVIGVLSAPLITFLLFFLDARWGMTPAWRAIFLAGNSAVASVGLATIGRRGEAMFRESPARVVRVAGLVIAFAVGLVLVGALVPVFALMWALFAVASTCTAAVTPALAVAAQSVVPSRTRPHQAALTGIASAVGAILGLIFFAGIDARYGIIGSLVAVVVPGVLGALIISSASQFVTADLDRMVEAIIEDEEVATRRRTGEHVPLLGCHAVDFSYGAVQVLFDVDFTVDDGELIALLGVNGAGKSTLLKVISGICLPQRGTVRLDGRDITYVDTERRVRMGITQIPGGRAVFTPMSVIDNLRTYGTTLGQSRRAVDRAIEMCVDAFPWIDARRNQAAGTLSGGEQQMVALCKALMLAPRLLLIDELSLGLAPVVVGQLLDMVTSINQAGTAVVIVEQSANVALNLADHAYFMEKGEIRFDGPSDLLLARGDLLRAVFLHGASKAVGR